MKGTQTAIICCIAIILISVAATSAFTAEQLKSQQDWEEADKFSEVAPAAMATPQERATAAPDEFTEALSDDFTEAKPKTPEEKAAKVARKAARKAARQAKAAAKATADADAARKGAAQDDKVQYTPDQADWGTFQSVPMAVASITGHYPNSIGWKSAASWESARWDGTVYNPSKMTRKEFIAAICPSVDQIRGIREVFYQHNPFADNTNPTKAEVDEWHRIAINHVRSLIGYTSPDRRVTKDHCMFARALWGDERKYTTEWDARYPGTVGSAAGPCQYPSSYTGKQNAHCGASFLPSKTTDQAPYLPDGHPKCTAGGGSEGVFSGPKTDIPWSVKWSRGLCNTLHAEGFWGGHTGPFFHREKFGFSFWDTGSHAILRAKWTGNLMSNLYCKPGTKGCNPDNTGP